MFDKQSNLSQISKRGRLLAALRLLFGTLLLLGNFRAACSPSRNRFRANSFEEQIGMYFAYALGIGLGVWLIRSGLRPFFPHQEPRK